MFKVIICGSRDFSDYQLLKEQCSYYLSNFLQSEITVVSGCAKGADTLGERYAIENGFDILKYPADWDRYGKSAGYKRNQQMAEIADGVIAFWDGKSKGTNHMINIAKEKNIRVIVIHYKEIR
jgi:hypothetical protein